MGCSLLARPDGAKPPDTTTDANERERVSHASGAGIAGVPASERVGGFGGAKPPDMTTEKKRIAAIVFFFLAAVIFWGAYEQAGSTLNLFAERNTNRVVLGYEFPASWYQSVQPILVIILAPLYAWLWIRLGNREPSSPSKFSLGLFLVGMSFLIMVPPGFRTHVSPHWLNVCYLLSVLGEMCLSPVGLSAMTKLAPMRAQGFVMGVWFLSLGTGNWLAGKAGSLYEIVPLPTLFGVGAGVAIAAAVLLAILVRPTKKLMVGVS